MALDLAMNALRRGEIDTAIVAAVDCANNPVHVACKSIVTSRPIVGIDGAAMVVLKRHAVSATEVLATFGTETSCPSTIQSLD